MPQSTHNTAVKISEGFPNERLRLLPERLLEELRTHPLASKLHPTRIGFFPDATGHYMERPQGIPEHIILLCLKGMGEIECAGSRRHIEGPACVWLRAGQPHRYAASTNSPWTLAWIHLAGSEAEAYLNYFGPAARPLPLQQSQLARDRFERILSLVESPHSPVTRLALHTELANWLAGLAQGHEALLVGQDPRRERIDRVLRHLREHLHASISLDAMATVAGWTPNHLSRVFREVLKDSPAAYFQHLKMTRACEQLRHSHRSIGEIADSLGYEDAFYFSRCFRRCYGLSPSEYRKSG